MPDILALTSFEHNGKRKKGDVFSVSDAHAAALCRAGLAMDVEEIPPTLATGKEAISSVLPVALVLPPQTVNSSSGGNLKRSKAGRPKKELSSS